MLRSCLVIAILMIAGSAQAATMTVCLSGCEYPSIQKAIDDANAGDTVEVHSGDYYEDIQFSKAYVRLIGIDTGKGRPRIHGNWLGSAIAEGQVVQGFEIVYEP